MKPTEPRKASSSHGPNFPYDDLHNDDVAHEHSDINIRAVITSAVVVAVVCLTTAALMGLLLKFFNSEANARDPQRSPLSMPATNMPPTTLTSPTFGNAPEPRLLTDEPVNLDRFRQPLREQLHGYAWVDEKAGVARIPIGEAKRLVAERGLPVRPDPVTDPNLGTRAPAFGESSSGRTITNPPAGAAAQAPAAPVHKDH